MRFLVIGLGSAGQRHARVMRKVFPEAEIDVFVKGRKVGLISKDLTSINLSESPTQHYKLNDIESIPKTANFYDLAVIATPISSHYEYFQMIFDCSRRILIEKPIARTLDESLLISNASIASGKAGSWAINTPSIQSQTGSKRYAALGRHLNLLRSTLKSTCGT